MQRLRKPSRVDILKTQERSDPVRWGKRIYFALLLGLAVLAADYAVGDALVLRADGLVVSDRHLVAATYAARVSAVHVREGERVVAGQALLDLESAEMLRDIAQVAGQSAELGSRETQMRVRAATLAALLPLADRHAQESAQVVRRLEPMTDRGMVTWQRYDQALGSGFETAARLAGLRGEAAVLERELSMLGQSRARADGTLRQLESFYDNGHVRATADGVVGSQVPAPGRVVRFGEELMAIHGHEARVIAYLPDIYLFGLGAGDRVELTAGSARAEGVVEALLSVADALPPEFQSMFRPRDRSRLVRIRLEDGRAFAVSQKVQVRGCAFGWCWRRAPESMAVAAAR